MTDYERTTVRESAIDPAPADRHDAERVVTRETAYSPGPTGGEMLRRVVILLFGILQALLILRIILLLLIANTGNDIVSLILGVTAPFVEPFRGMFALDRMTADQGSTLDVAAIVALIAWTLIEALILAVLSLGSRRRSEVA